jgi:SNF2 family DNA or RNA helicase
MLRQATGVAKAAFVADFVRLLVESGEKVVLFGWHREVYSLWMDRLSDLGPALYTGSESPTQKDDARRRFLEGQTPILIMSLRSGAGLDGLQNVSRTVVFGELDWSPGVHEQCVGRVYRDGQPEPVVAYFLVAEHGSDPAIADVLQIKRAQVDGVRDPLAALVEPLDQGSERVRRLASDYLRQRGHAVREEAAQRAS